MKKRPYGVVIAWVGLGLSICGWLLSFSANGLSGIAFAPIVWVGVIVFIVGLIKSFIDFTSLSKTLKIACLITWVFAVVAVIVYILPWYQVANSQAKCQKNALNSTQYEACIGGPTPYTVPQSN